MKRKHITGIVAIILIFLIFKFMDGRNVSDEGINDAETKKTVTQGIDNDKKKEITTQDLIIFVPNETRTVIEERHVTLSNSENKTTVELLLDALRESGGNDDKYQKPIPSTMFVNSITLKGDTVTVDFKKKGINYDPANESLILDCLVLTMTTLKGVDKVQILVDGKKTEDFMGTFNTGTPLSIKDVTNNVNYLDEDSTEDKKTEGEE